MSQNYSKTSKLLYQKPSRNSSRKNYSCARLHHCEFKRNKIAICRIEEWNNLLHEHYGDGENIQIIDLNKQVKSSKNPETLYFDDIHFNFQLGLPLIRNSLMKYITWFSNNLLRINTTYYRPNSSYWKPNTKYPKYTHKNQYQYYHHQPLTTFHYMGDV